jgi:hypothetical protein
MDLLLVGDGSKYINLSKVDVFDVQGATYYRSEHGVWVRKEAKSPLGEVVAAPEVFKVFMSEHMFNEAQEYFQQLFEGGAEISMEPNTNPPEPKKWLMLRFMIVGLVGLLLAAYVAAIITGGISANHQISIADLGVIVIGAMAIGILIRPQLVRNIQRFELGTLRFELRDQVRDLQNTQKDQKRELDELRFTLNLLVTDSERKHLENLDTGSTANYKRNDWLQAELRRLRSIGLITSKRYISDMPAEFDLREWGVELTPYGTEYLRRWKEAGRSGGTS